MAGKNSRFDEYREENENLFEGKNAVWELVRSDRDIDKILFAKGSVKSLGHIIAKAREKGVATQECDRRKLDQMSITGSHQGIIAIASSIEYKTPDDILENAWYYLALRFALSVRENEVSAGITIRSVEIGNFISPNGRHNSRSGRPAHPDTVP